MFDLPSFLFAGMSQAAISDELRALGMISDEMAGSQRRAPKRSGRTISAAAHRRKGLKKGARRARRRRAA